MLIEISLCDADRERLGVSSEWIEYDHDKVGIRLLAEVQRTLGLTIPEFGRGIAEGNALAVWAVTWIAVRMAGVGVKLEDFDFQPNSARMRQPETPVDDDAVDGLGKEDPSTPSTGTPTPKRSPTTRTSTRSSAPTRSRSRT